MNEYKERPFHLIEFYFDYYKTEKDTSHPSAHVAVMRSMQQQNYKNKLCAKQNFLKHH